MLVFIFSWNLNVGAFEDGGGLVSKFRNVAFTHKPDNTFFFDLYGFTSDHVILKDARMGVFHLFHFASPCSQERKAERSTTDD